jgi:hypothetical protein
LNAKPDRPRKLGQATSRTSNQKEKYIYSYFPFFAEPDRARKLGKQARFQVNSQTAKSPWLSGEKHQVPNYVKRGEEV